MATDTRTPNPVSSRRQLNVRLDEETDRRIARLLPLVSRSLGLQVKQSDLVRLAMVALEREYTQSSEGRRDRQAK